MANEFFREVAELAGENVIQAIEGGDLSVAVKGEVVKGEVVKGEVVKGEVVKGEVG